EGRRLLRASASAAGRPARDPRRRLVALRAARRATLARMAASNVIAFDIEVAGFAWEEVDEITRGYLVNRERDEVKRAAVPERTALYPGLGKIIAIGMWLVGAELDRGMILLEGASHEE